MFTAHDLELPLGFDVAQARLARLAQEGGLRGASMRSYSGEGEVEILLRAEPLPKLVSIRFLAPVYRDGEMSLGLRWEATGVTGSLFPVLDANITLTRVAEHQTKLALIGSYRPPLGAFGAGLDRAILHQVAAATIRGLLRAVAHTITCDGEDDCCDDHDPTADPERPRDA